jgi:hypothetical protein
MLVSFMIWSPVTWGSWIPPWFWWPWPRMGRGFCRWIQLHWLFPYWAYPVYTIDETRKLLEWWRLTLENELKAVEERLKEFKK